MVARDALILAGSEIARGRKQNRTGRKQDRSDRKTLDLRTLNVQHQWARLLLQGAKIAEVRTFNLGRRQGEEHWIEETGGNKPPLGFKNFIVGVIKFKGDCQYTSYSHFRSDEVCHQIPAGSSFDWELQKPRFCMGGLLTMCGVQSNLCLLRLSRE